MRSELSHIHRQSCAGLLQGRLGCEGHRSVLSGQEGEQFVIRSFSVFAYCTGGIVIAAIALLSGGLS